jgi:hypothetical protein
VTGNYAKANGVGFSLFSGSTAISNTAVGNTVGIVVGCPSNVIDNTAVDNDRNLVLNGTDCHSEDNLAP